MAEWEDLAAAELGRLEQPHATKKRTTIIALVDCRLAGISEETVFQRRDTCSRNTYHAKWKKDVVFAEVLETVTELARDWHGGRAMRAMAQASERLALASPGAVAKVVEVLTKSTDDQAVLRAAFGILDRAGLETATKSTSEVTGVPLEEWRKEQAERHERVNQALDDFADIDADDTQ